MEKIDKELIIDFIGKADYDDYGQMIWAKYKDGNMQMMCDVRGWGAIQNMFIEGGKVNVDKARKFQEQLGWFITNAINEKVERWKKENGQDEPNEISPNQQKLF
jgi:hypothetical protein